MPVYHIVLFKLKPGTSTDQISELKNVAAAMVGQIPGLIRLDFGAPHASTAHRAQGFELGIVAILEKPGDIQVYAEHPAHQKVHEFRTALATDTLAYDLEY